MRKLSRTCLLATVGLVAVAAQAPAEEGSWLPGELSGNVGFVSDYSFRGISQTNENLAVQGGIDWSHDTGLFFGLWASNIEFTEADIEQDIYGGYAGEMGALSYDIGAYFFYYPKEEKANYWEFAGNLGYDLEVASLSFGALYSPEYFGYFTDDDGFYLSSGVAVPLPVDLPGIELSVDANIGFTSADNVAGAGEDDYIDYNVGLGIGLPQNLGVDLRFVGTDADDLGDIADDRFIAGLSYSF